MVTSMQALILIRTILNHKPDTCLYIKRWSCQLCSSKQSIMAGSTCEAEYIAASEATNEGVWMKEFISDLGVIPSASGPMKIFCDNTGAIALAKESRYHKRTKHIKRRFNSIRDLVQVGDIEICKIHTDLNVADPLTKPLPRAKHDQHQDSMGVRIITVQSRLLTLVQVGD